MLGLEQLTGVNRFREEIIARLFDFEVGKGATLKGKKQYIYIGRAANDLGMNSDRL